MANRKYTPEEKEAASKKRNMINSQRIFIQRQAKLRQRMETGELTIKTCICGKIFDQKTYGPVGRGGLREYCPRCPIKPPTKERRIFNKRSGTWATYQVKRR